MKQFDSCDETKNSTNKRTYFGLKVYSWNNDQTGGSYVKNSDIANLPFYDFWEEKSMGSTCIPIENNDIGIYLIDWEKFCRLFISTGK